MGNEIIDKIINERRPRSANFEERIAPLVAYYKEFGTIKNIAQRDEYVYNGRNYKIGDLVCNLRTCYKDGKLKEQEIKQLEQMGIDWGKRRNFDSVMAPFVEYYKTYGSIADIAGDVSIEVDGRVYNLKVCLNNLRMDYKAGRLSKERIEALEKMGMVWKKYGFSTRIAPLVDYYKNYKTIEHIPLNTTYEYKGKLYNIGKLIETIRGEYKKNQLSSDKIELLEKMGMVWEPNTFEKRVAPLVGYYNEFGSLDYIKPTTEYEFNDKIVYIGRLLEKIREQYHEGRLSPEQIKYLEDIEISWKSTAHRPKRLDVFRAYYNDPKGGNGTLANIKIFDKYVYDGKVCNIGSMRQTIRRSRKLKILDEETIKELDSMGFQWERKKTQSHNLNN